jgi:hypothetical protein
MANIKRAIVPAMLGIIGLGAMTRNPRFETFHAVDMLQLVASGMCFGVALALLLHRGLKSSGE